MSVFPKQNEVINAVLTGIKTAKGNFTNWTTQELFLSETISKFLTVHISQEIAKIKNTPEIFMDATVADILRCSLPQKNEFKQFMEKKNMKNDSFSLTLDERFEHKSEDDSISRVVISVNHVVGNTKPEYINSIDTMCKIIDRKNQKDSTLDYGIIALYLDISNTARKKSESRLKDILDAFDSVILSRKNLKSYYKGISINKIENVGEWCMGCYIVEPVFDQYFKEVKG